MKIRGLLIATLVFAALAGVLYWSDHRKSSAQAAKPSTDTATAILKLDQNSVNKLELRKKDQPTIQLDKPGSDWKITEPKPFAADQSTISTMLSSLSSLNSERLVDDKSTDLQRYGLDHPSFELDISEKDNRGQRILFGDDTPTGNAVYLALAGDPRIFTVAGYTKDSLDKNLNDLRDKRFLTVNADKISRVELAGKQGDIEFGRNQDEWQILKPKPMRQCRGGERTRPQADGCPHGPQWPRHCSERGGFRLQSWRSCRDGEGHGRIRHARASPAQRQERVLRQI